jgi:hypothetical protein
VVVVVVVKISCFALMTKGGEVRGSKVWGSGCN